MASYETTRTVTTKSTVPAGTAGTGTVTALAANNAALQVTGGVIGEFSAFRDKGYRNQWIYCTVEHKVAQIKSILRNTDSSFVIYTDRVLPFVFNSPFTIITGDLIDYSVKNNGAVDGELDGAALEPDDAVNPGIQHVPGNGYPKEHSVVTINGTGTSLVINEVK